MSEEVQDPQTKQHDLLFGIRRSVRYHVRRRQHFERLGKFIKIFTAIGGVGAVTTILGKANEWWTLVYCAAAGFFSLIDLVIGTGERAARHGDLSKEFIELEKQMVLAGGNLRGEELARFTARRLEIEAEEPPALRVLDTICHNDLVRAMGYDKLHQKKVTWAQKVFSQFFDWRLEDTENPPKLVEHEG